MSAAVSGVRLASARVVTWRAAPGLALALAFAVAAAVTERASASSGAADRALGGAAFGIALPLVTLFAVELLCRGERLDRALEVVGRFGVHRRLAGLGALLTTAALGGIFAGTLGALTVAFARPVSDPVLAADVLATGWIGVLGGAAYVGWFGLGSAFGSGGRGRYWLLAIDWLAGASQSVVALPCPRSYIRMLVGAEPASFPVLGLALILSGFAVGYCLLATARCPP